MADKIIIPDDLLKNMVERMNNKEITIGGLAAETGYSRKAISRRIAEAGYRYDKSTCKYFLESSTPDPNANVASHTKNTNPINTVKKEIAATQETVISVAPTEMIENKPHKRAVGRPRNSEDLQKHTLALPKDLWKAIQRKALEEEKPVTQIIRDILKAGIEDKYFKQY